MGHKVLFLAGLVMLSVWRGPCMAGEQPVLPAAAPDPLMHASEMLGTRYRYGGKSPATGFDCSGLVAHVFERAWGLSLPHNAHAQSKVGTPVKRVALVPGDLVFYNTRNRPYSHVGIYVGEGRFLHAPRPGARVRIENLDTKYWRARFNGARRMENPRA